MWAEGLTAIEISHQLKVSLRTVQQFRHEVRTKLRAKTLRDMMRIGVAVRDLPRGSSRLELMQRRQVGEMPPPL
jgi:DNA-binding NarL/FixJ family response regulator